jgi:hypothetical protein
MRGDTVNVLTIHAEIEGMGKRALFRALLRACADRGVQFVRLDEVARALLADRAALPVRDQVLASVDGRSGLVATQAAA